MINDCRHKNKLLRDGVSQDTRTLPALDPAYAPVDGKSFLDQLSFVKQYATQLNFYDHTNKKVGNWEVFFNEDCASLLADIAGFDPEKVLQSFNKAADAIEAGSEVKLQIKNQFVLLFTLLFEAERWVRNTDTGLKLYNDIDNEISSVFSLELLSLIGYYKKAVAINLINEDNFEKGTFGQCWYRYLDPVSELPYANWEAYYNSIGPSEVYKPTGNLRKKGSYSQFFLEKSLKKILSGYARLLQNTNLYLQDILTNYPSHEPHMGLLLSWLQLFRYARDQINTLTKRHLDFYFREVLGLKKHKAVSDKAHVVFELAKSISSLKVAKDIALSAGKDRIKEEILFYTSKESVFNTAKIKEQKNIHIDKNLDSRIYASPDVNSPDVNSPDAYLPFGEKQDLSSSKRTMPEAKIGFMVASETLLLTEGERKIQLDIQCKLSASDLTETLIQGGFKAHISGEKGWIEYTPAILLNTEFKQEIHKNHLIFNQNKIILSLKISEEKGPIVAHDPKIHDPRFDQKAPIIYLECMHNKSRYIYNFLKQIRIEFIDITVSTDKISKLLLQSDESVLDPSKPFTPFGSVPGVGSSFILASNEVFNKKISRLELFGKWNEYPIHDGIHKHYNKYDTSVTYDIFKVQPYILRNGNWITEGAELPLFKGDQDDDFTLAFPVNADSPIGEADMNTFPEKYDINAQSGFIRLELADNEGFAFGHKEFPKVYAQEAIKQSLLLKLADIDTLDFPNEPYTPKLKDFHMEYDAKGSIKFGGTVSEKDNDGCFCQVYPFGYKTLTAHTASEDLYLLPRFEHMEKGSGKWHNGELLLGFENINPPASLELLFKVAEGSEDPELMPQKINWFYLANGGWEAFKSSEIIADNTKNLSSSAILSLAIPRIKSLKTSELTSNLLWIKGAIETNTNAACRIIAIHPQSALIEFKDNNNDPQRSATALKAGSISKLKIKNPSVKSLSQPYSSFGGKAEETPAAFYVRSSERLRHKNRGITIWDYERIILQEFPDLYKVKCINHTSYAYYEDLGGEMDSEFAPGYVTLILLPKTFNQNAINPYEPKVTKADILQIEDLVRKRITVFAANKLKILNPLYEQIQLEFEVEFHKQYSDRGFYEKQLNADLKKHLAPWAFTTGKDITLGGKIYKSSLIDFMEELYYVDYLKDVKMHQYVNRVLYKSDIQTAMPGTARSAFVTINHSDGCTEHIVKEIS